LVTGSADGWPPTQRGPRPIAQEHGLTFSEDGLTIVEKIAELEKMSISPPAKG
jgi:hypothetical protein